MIGMTEKRFMLTDNGYIYDKEDGAIHQTIETVVKQLNEFYDEIEEISNTLDNMVTFKNKYRDKYKEMKEENEQLKQQNEALSEFEHKVFDLINEKINEMQTEYDTDSMESPSWYTGLQYGIETFKELKEELKP